MLKKNVGCVEERNLSYANCGSEEIMSIEMKHEGNNIYSIRVDDKRIGSMWIIDRRDVKTAKSISINISPKLWGSEYIIGQTIVQGNEIVIQLYGESNKQ